MVSDVAGGRFNRSLHSWMPRRRQNRSNQDAKHTVVVGHKCEDQGFEELPGRSGRGGFGAVYLQNPSVLNRHRAALQNSDCLDF